MEGEGKSGKKLFGQRKLTEDAVKNIRALRRDTPLTLKQIGDLYGVSGSTVSRIKNRELWAHVE